MSFLYLLSIGEGTDYKVLGYCPALEFFELVFCTVFHFFKFSMLSEVCPSRQALDHLPMLLFVLSSFVWLLDILLEASNATLSSNGFKYFAVVVSSKTFSNDLNVVEAFLMTLFSFFFQGGVLLIRFVAFRDVTLSFTSVI